MAQPMGEGRHCPHPFCDVTDLPAERYACSRHWHGLPSTIRVRISMAWRRFNRNPSSLTHLESLQAAQADAVDHWEVSTGERR